MDIGKMLSMLQRDALYFRKIDAFEDKFEGLFTQAMHQNMDVYAGLMVSQATQRGDKLSIDVALEITKRAFDDARQYRKQIFANCWHMNEEESEAMWKLYTAQSESIAISTSFCTLCDSLPDYINIGKITYLDYRNDIIQPGNIFYPAMHKRRSYEHEKEVRAIFWDDGHTPIPDTVEKAGEDGIFVKCDTKSLIENVYVSPKASSEFRLVIENVLRLYDISVTVLQSEVNAPPAY